MTENQQKLVGVGLMIPAIVLVVYLAVSIQFWAIAVSCVVTGTMAAVGYHMIKGATAKEAVDDVIEDLKK